MALPENKDLSAFKAINAFVQDLDAVYGKKHKPLKLYKHLLSKTTFTNTTAVFTTTPLVIMITDLVTRTSTQSLPLTVAS